MVLSMYPTINNEDCFVHQFSESNCYVCLSEEQDRDTCLHAWITNSLSPVSPTTLRAYLQAFSHWYSVRVNGLTVLPSLRRSSKGVASVVKEEMAPAAAKK